MYMSKLRVLRLKTISRRNRDVIAARAAYTYVCGRGMRKRDMIHPSRRETNQLCLDRGAIGVGVRYLSVAFTSCDTIMADLTI